MTDRQHLEQARTHEFKTWPTYFEDVALGAKRVEIRENDRGGFCSDDRMILHEYDPRPCPGDQEGIIGYTGRRVRARITYTHQGLGLMPGYAALCFEVTGTENV